MSEYQESQNLCKTYKAIGKGRYYNFLSASAFTMFRYPLDFLTFLLDFSSSFTFLVVCTFLS